MSLLVGCSSESENIHKDMIIKWENGVMTINGDVQNVVAHCGSYADYEGTDIKQLTFSLDNADDPTWLSVNAQGIEGVDMTDYKGCKQFFMYNGSKAVLAKPLEDGDWIVALAVGYDTVGMAAVSEIMYKMIGNIHLSDAQTYVDFGSFRFGSSWDGIKCNSSGASIPGIAKVSPGEKAECTTPTTIIQGDKEYQVMKYSSAKYDYYTYDGFTIQVVIGLSLTDYVTFK